MPFIDRTNWTWQCTCGKVFTLSPNATRCPCECHKPQLDKAKAQGTHCEVCDFATLDPYVFQAHFAWPTHQKAAAAKGITPDQEKAQTQETQETTQEATNGEG